MELIEKKFFALRGKDNPDMFLTTGLFWSSDYDQLENSEELARQLKMINPEMLSSAWSKPDSEWGEAFANGHLLDYRTARIGIKLLHENREFREGEYLFAVYVGNVGCVYHGPDIFQAVEDYIGWARNAWVGHGRAANEDVTLMAEGADNKDTFILHEQCHTPHDPELKWGKDYDGSYPVINTYSLDVATNPSPYLVEAIENMAKNLSNGNPYRALDILNTIRELAANYANAITQQIRYDLQVRGMSPYDEDLLYTSGFRKSPCAGTEEST